MNKSSLESELLFHIRAIKLPEPVCEFKFHPVRKWQFDFAWEDKLLAVEVEGGTWVKGRHTRGQGFENDCEKYNAATLMGWRVLRYTAKMIESGEAINQIEEALCSQKII